MARAIGRPRPKTPPKPNTRVSPFAWLLLLPLIFFVPVMLVVIIAMLPTFTAAITDRRPEKTAALCVGGCNLSATIPFVIHLVLTERGMAIFWGFVNDYTAWLVTYGAAAIGWGLVWIIPKGMVRLSNWMGARDLSGLRKRQQELIDEWGVELIEADHEEPDGEPA